MKPLTAALCTMITLIAGPLAAQVDDAAMEEQRCIWRCMADIPDWQTNPAYGQCSQECSDAAPAQSVPPPAAAPPPATAWTEGATRDGNGRFAAVVDPAAGTRMVYMCDAAGQSLLALEGVNGWLGDLFVYVDSQRYQIESFVQGNVAYARIPPGVGLFNALTSGRVAEFRDLDGTSVGTFSLAGSTAAITAARTACR